MQRLVTIYQMMTSILVPATFHSVGRLAWGLNKAGASLHILQVHPTPVRHGSNYITSIQPRPALISHIFYWVLSPVLLDRPIYLSNFISIASHYVSHNFIHLSLGPTVLDCINHFKPTQVLFMCD